MYHKLTTIIQQLLTQHGMWFETFEHEPVRTSEEAAKLRHGYRIHQGAKALIVRVKKSGEKFFAMVVVPGDQRFSNDKVKKIFGAKDIRFATEDEVDSLTQGVQPGGVPPFGNLFNMQVLVEKTLLIQEKIIFNAGDRSFSIGMKSKDYIVLVQPVIEDIL